MINVLVNLSDIDVETEISSIGNDRFYKNVGHALTISFELNT